MTARIRKLLSDLRDAFWLIPASMVAAGILLALCLVRLDRGGLVPQWLTEGQWLYGGGATGARTLLGTVAASAIGVAGTVFSITIAALSLAAGQMGPRLLRNFTRDRGNQITLGIFLGTFSYALMVLRSIRTVSEGDFVPHFALSFGVMLAFMSVATLVYFVQHMSGRINVDTVVELVSLDAQSALRRLTTDTEQPAPPSGDPFPDATPLTDPRRGYLQQLDADGLADWAARNGTVIRMLVRPGDYVFPGAPIAVMTKPAEGAAAAIHSAVALGHQRGSPADLEFALRQMVEVAVRALSPGINDPYTAMSVVDRLGAVLCEIASRHLPTGVTLRDGAPVLIVPAVDYDELVDIMFHMIRRHASGNAAMLIRILQVLTSVLGCERHPDRVDTLQRHANVVMEDAERCIANASDLLDVRHRYRMFIDARRHGPGRSGPDAD